MPTNLTDLVPNEGANKDRRRVGRGHGSGRGKTAGRGTKGQKARTGGGVRPGFEGGQLPIQKRMPYKRGFTNIYQTPWEIVNLGTLNDLPVEGPITPEMLAERGLIRGVQYPVKILAGGELSTKLDVHAHAFSAAARAAIEAQGGSVVALERTDRWVNARPRSRRPAIDRNLKDARLGKVGGIERRSELSDS
jgi:large subunit ribosomal protein L15